MNLGDRMKRYEIVPRNYLTRRMPVIMRIDGKAFHTFVRAYDKPEEIPYIAELHESMVYTMEFLIKNIMGAKIGYTQSDEISILITDFDRLETEAWFDYNVQKMTSIGSSLTTAFFNKHLNPEHLAFFDCRVFNIPKEDVRNYFIWRQQDWVRNSVSLYTRHFYSHKECHGKKQADMHEMLHAKGKNWAALDLKWKNGTFLFHDEGPLPVAAWCYNLRDFGHSVIDNYLEPKDEEDGNTE